jgi:hypothetical protein
LSVHTINARYTAATPTAASQTTTARFKLLPSPRKPPAVIPGVSTTLVLVLMNWSAAANVY